MRCLRIAAEMGGEGDRCSVLVACFMICHYYGAYIHVTASQVAEKLGIVQRKTYLRG